LLHENKNYDPQQIVDKVLNRLCKNKNILNIPILKYLKAIGITSKEECESRYAYLKNIIDRDFDNFKSKNHEKSFLRDHSNKTLEEIINDLTPEKASNYIPYLSKGDINVEIFRNFLIKNESKLDHQTSKYASSFRKLLALYDKLKWGW
jgi:hypothetical protein